MQKSFEWPSDRVRCAHELLLCNALLFSAPSGLVREPGFLGLLLLLQAWA